MSSSTSSTFKISWLRLSTIASDDTKLSHNASHAFACCMLFNCGFGGRSNLGAPPIRAGESYRHCGGGVVLGEALVDEELRSLGMKRPPAVKLAGVMASAELGVYELPTGSNSPAIHRGHRRG